MNFNKLYAISVTIVVIALLFHSFLMPSEAAARKYQYRVISIQGMTELRTQGNTENGRLATIEKVVNDQAAQGWELMQADGYVLYFRR
jgi:hypothetical protein